MSHFPLRDTLDILLIWSLHFIDMVLQRKIKGNFII